MTIDIKAIQDMLADKGLGEQAIHLFTVLCKEVEELKIELRDQAVERRRIQVGCQDLFSFIGRTADRPDLVKQATDHGISKYGLEDEEYGLAQQETRDALYAKAVAKRSAGD